MRFALLVWMTLATTAFAVYGPEINRSPAVLDLPRDQETAFEPPTQELPD